MESIEDTQKAFYLTKFGEYGDDPKALSWNDQATQFLRFQNLAHIFQYEDSSPFTIHEVGCGLAHFKEYLEKTYNQALYSGSDIIPEFIKQCELKYPQHEFTLQSIADSYQKINNRVKGKDYYSLSGTFYTKEKNSAKDWEAFIFKSIKNMFKMAGKGIAFNFLTSYSSFNDENLYYADPKKILDFCCNNLSRFVSVYHDIPLYEFTVCVYKDKFIKERFPVFSKYFYIA